jgi:hypothetical protein
MTYSCYIDSLETLALVLSWLAEFLKDHPGYRKPKGTTLRSPELLAQIFDSSTTAVLLTQTQPMCIFIISLSHFGGYSQFLLLSSMSMS